MSNLPEDTLAPAPTDRTSETDDERIENILPLPPPAHLIQFFPIKNTPAEGFIAETRHNVRDIVHGHSDRLLVVIGPCSIHDPVSALEYASRIQAVLNGYPTASPHRAAEAPGSGCLQVHSNRG
jgi:3-deoxy-7-phosphoheptulonate synthase